MELKDKTTLEDFCGFIENELCLPMTTEQRKIYNEQKAVSLINERKEIDELRQAIRDTLNVWGHQYKGTGSPHYKRLQKLLNEETEV